MFGLPIEAISMLASTLLGGFMKMWGQSQQDKAEQWKMAMAKDAQIFKEVNNARQYQNPNAAWIRRFIVIMALGGGMAIVFLAPLMGQPTNIPIEVTTGTSFLFWDNTSTEVIYQTLEGFVTPEWLPVAIMNIIGFYFGSAAMSRR